MKVSKIVFCLFWSLLLMQAKCEPKQDPNTSSAGLTEPSDAPLTLLSGTSSDVEAIRPITREGRLLKRILQQMAKGTCNRKKEEVIDVLNAAITAGEQDIVLAFIACVRASLLNKKGSDGYTPLHTAVSHNRVDLISAIKDSRASLDALDNVGFTPLIYAILSVKKNAARALITAGANVNKGDDAGNRPLHMAAAEEGQEDIIRELANAGANPNAENKPLRRTPLHEAAKVGEEGAISALLDIGADINKLDGEGNSPLHRAAKAGQTGAVRVLLARGAIKTGNNKDGKTPLQLAGENNHTETADALR